MSAYAELLKRPEWAEKRARILERDQHCCIRCCSEKNLNVHHLYYISGRMPWQYPDGTLRTLCKSCHKRDHELQKEEYEKWEEALDYFGAFDPGIESQVQDLGYLVLMMEMNKGRSRRKTIAETATWLSHVIYGNLHPLDIILQSLRYRTAA